MDETSRNWNHEVLNFLINKSVEKNRVIKNIKSIKKIIFPSFFLNGNRSNKLL